MHNDLPLDRLPWHQAAWSVWLNQAERMSHAYLLHSSPGTGSRQFADAMIQSLLCQSDGLVACGSCSGCHQFALRSHPDFFEVSVLEDKKEISIDQIRALTDKVYTTSHQGGYKVALIESVETLNQNAFNALLKTLEEPPEKTVLILTANLSSELPATIVSRCRKINLNMPNLDQAIDWLSQQIEGDIPLLKKALKNNWGGPVAARDWIENKQFEQEAQWQKDMKQLLNRQDSLSQTVEKWMKFEVPLAVLDYFYLASVTAIRGSLYQQKYPFNPNWLSFQKSLLNARGLWQQNINKQLLLENLCLEWLNCQTPNYKASAALKTQQLRGESI